jgi:hypothetical protein
MNKNVLVSGVFIIMALLGGYWWGTRTTQTPLVNTEPTTTSTENSTTGSNTQTTNTSVITPTPKKTETPKAPVGKLYTDPNGDFSFRYPENYTYEKEPLVPGEMGGYAQRFYEKGTSWEQNETKSFVIEKRRLETYQINITGGVGCVYNPSTNAFKIASALTEKTECDNLAKKTNTNGVVYFTSSENEGSITTTRKSFISEDKGMVVTLVATSNQNGSIPVSINDLITQSVTFK